MDCGTQSECAVYLLWNFLGIDETRPNPKTMWELSIIGAQLWMIYICFDWSEITHLMKLYTCAHLFVMNRLNIISEQSPLGVLWNFQFNYYLQQIVGLYCVDYLYIELQVYLFPLFFLMRQMPHACNLIDLFDTLVRLHWTINTFCLKQYCWIVDIDKYHNILEILVHSIYRSLFALPILYFGFSVLQTWKLHWYLLYFQKLP